jgi:hypothetical protein
VEVNLVPCAMVSTPLYGAMQQGPNNLSWAGHPRLGHESRAQRVVGPIGGEINLTKGNTFLTIVASLKIGTS